MAPPAQSLGERETTSSALRAVRPPGQWHLPADFNLPPAANACAASDVPRGHIGFADRVGTEPHIL
jgi:hypothetical protein